jgi:hypothetical protein
MTLTPGQKIQNARLELTETGAISGRILYPNGQPFANVQVQALRYGYEEGRRVLKTVRSVVTDDLGQYRLFWLPPGPYVLMAKPIRGALPQMVLDMMPGGGVASRPIGQATGEVILPPEEDGFVPMFFPGHHYRTPHLRLSCSRAQMFVGSISYSRRSSRIAFAELLRDFPRRQIEPAFRQYES